MDALSMYEMRGKVAIVTGASSGIGRATARLFATCGARVLMSDVDEAGGKAAADDIRRGGGAAAFIRCDISRTSDVRAMVDRSISEFGRLDFACNNAGIEGEQAETADCTEENWERVLGVNLRGTWLCMKYEIPRLLESGGGAIVNISSIAGLVGFAGIPAYVASKHGMNGLTRTAAIEYAKRNIRVNAICPGAIETPMIDRFVAEGSEARSELIAAHPMGRMGRPEEIAEVAVWLCSAGASFVTGQLLAADGGYVAQ
jgi:NAD(P)-dependent dehydrogenase (short-subunit alcohol dehydrogenase family)